MALHLPAHSLSDAPPSPLTGVHLNADGSLFATSTVEGWVVYRTQPLEVLTRRHVPNASLRLVLPLERSNLLFLVGGPPSPLYPPNKVILWDARTEARVAELEFREDVRGLRARRDRLVVVLRRRVVVFVLGEGDAGIWREGAYETCDNPRGLAALATAPLSTLLAFPGRQPGQVQLVLLPPLPRERAPPLPPPPSHDPTSPPHPSVSVLVAHSAPLAALACDPRGRVLATGSARGTLVRVWDAAGRGSSGGGAPPLVRELRRGTDSAEIFDVSLSAEGDRVAVASDKGTVHVWDLRREARDEREKRKREASASGSSTPRLSLLKPYLPAYFSSEWSHAQFRLPAPPGTPPASRLPFSLANPGPIPRTPFSPAAGAGPGAGAGGEGLKGATSVEDDVCVCAWVEVDVPGGEEGDDAPHQVPPPAPAPAPAPAPDPHARRRSSAAQQPAPPPAPQRRRETQLVALTRSGGWYRLAFSPAPAPAPPHPSSSTSSSPSVTAKGKARERPRDAGAGTRSGSAAAEGVRGLARDATSECRVVEYRRFGGVEGW
ncbi:hypothetical protein DMC30DRAFT_203361, partial [Rhodotorula diobovata]